jgi:Fic family protein
MILNHKDAIEFLVGNADEIGFNRYRVLNLHALLANNLLADPTAVARLRHIAVGIEGSAFHPLEVPGQIEDNFNQLLATAAAIRDPFEQAFFMMVQLPYLQAFDDVNKRVSRLAANIPMITANLVPLSFTDVPNDLYARATLGVHERNDVAALRDVFLWAYERSVARYAAVRQSLGEPDPFRLRYRDRLRTTVRDIVRAPSDRQAARAHLTKVAHDEVQPEDQEQFIEVAETEFLGLREGNFARYQVRPSEFLAWSKKWDPA